jgi:hypothetical protein
VSRRGENRKQALGRVDEAIAWRERHAAHDPVNPIGHSNLGLDYLGAGRWDDAIASLETALRFSPGRLITRYDIGVALLMQGEPEAALESFSSEGDESLRVCTRGRAILIGPLSGWTGPTYRVTPTSSNSSRSPSINPCTPIRAGVNFWDAWAVRPSTCKPSSSTCRCRRNDRHSLVRTGRTRSGQRTHTVLPSLMVSRTWIWLIVAGSTVNGLSDSTTRSASLPSVMEPFVACSPNCSAPQRVIIFIAS